MNSFPFGSETEKYEVSFAECNQPFSSVTFAELQQILLQQSYIECKVSCVDKCFYLLKSITLTQITCQFFNF